jgi:hypothetical protein
VVEGQLEHGPPNINGLKHFHLPGRPGEAEQGLLSDQEAIKGCQPTPLFLSQQRNIEESIYLHQEQGIEKANHDDLLQRVSDHLVFSCQ